MDGLINIYKKQRDVFQYVFIALIVIMLGWLIFVSTVPVCKVSGYSMLPGINHEDLALLSKSSSYKRFEVVVFDNLDKDKKPIYTAATLPALIKRVVGIPGDTLKFEYAAGGTDYMDLYIKGAGETEFTKEDAWYINGAMTARPSVCNAEKNSVAMGAEFTIPEGRYYVMGDNRNDSTDSRVFGAVNKADISGAMFWRVKAGSFWDGFLNILYFGKLHNQAGDA